MVNLAFRVVSAAESATIGVARRAAELASQGHDLVDLGAGEPAFDSPRCAVEAAGTALRTGFTRYTSVDGTPDLRAALIEHYRALGGPWTGEGDVLVTVGAKSALLGTLLAVVDPGDEVIIPAPCWGSLPAQVALAGGNVVLVPRSPAQDFAFDVGDLIAAFTPRTKAVLINSPCNPTGAVLAVAELRRLAEHAAARDVLVILDATYEAFDYSPWGARNLHAVSVASDFPEHLVHISSFSKAYAMTGWRVGFALGPRHVIRGLRAVQSHATTHPTSFAMVGATAALLQGSSQVMDLVAQCRANRDFLVPALQNLRGVHCAMPGGSFYAFARIEELIGSPGLENSAAFSQRLLEEHRVVSVPGSAFRQEGYVRLSYAAARGRIEEGVARLSRFIDSLAPAQRRAVSPTPPERQPVESP